ncbi:periplasmic solute binding protein [Dehalogenimonas lykanthroporepellens BL-DC-9]|nr:periplasmic solute binding protein [Dehalogenimonas lykanthroporepellens BL-DC-9]
MKRWILVTLSLILLTLISLPLTACRVQPKKEGIVVTHAILGVIVEELAGDRIKVTTLMPGGADPHDWEPSARDIERLNNARLIVWNGLGLEESVAGAVDNAVAGGALLFTATDHIEIRYAGETEFGHKKDEDDHSHEPGAPDPHFWTDPLAMKQVVSALAQELLTQLNMDVTGRSAALIASLDNLHADVLTMLTVTPDDSRLLVTGHDSLGYFARRYGFDIMGTVVPGLSSQADISAADVAAIIAQIETHQVKAIFIEPGVSAGVARQISEATGAKVVELSPAALPDDGSYFTFILELAGKIADGLQ